MVEPVKHTYETADSIPFLCLHLLVNKPKCVEMTGEVTQAAVYQYSVRSNRGS